MQPERLTEPTRSAVRPACTGVGRTSSTGQSRPVTAVDRQVGTSQIRILGVGRPVVGTPDEIDVSQRGPGGQRLLGPGIVFPSLMNDLSTAMMVALREVEGERGPECPASGAPLFVLGVLDCRIELSRCFSTEIILDRLLVAVVLVEVLLFVASLLRCAVYQVWHRVGAARQRQTAVPRNVPGRSRLRGTLMDRSALCRSGNRGMRRCGETRFVLRRADGEGRRCCGCGAAARERDVRM